MCIRCEKCGWLGSSDELAYEFYDPSPSGISLPAGAYRENFCPDCGADQDYLNDFELEEEIDVEEAEDYTALMKAFCDSLKLDFSTDGIIEAITTKRGRWVLAE